MTIFTTPYDIHGWKATDLSFDLAPSDQNFMHPRSRQNFGDGPGQTPELILTLCHMITLVDMLAQVYPSPAPDPQTTENHSNFGVLVGIFLLCTHLPFQMSIQNPDFNEEILINEQARKPPSYASSELCPPTDRRGQSVELLA